MSKYGTVVAAVTEVKACTRIQKCQSFKPLPWFVLFIVVSLNFWLQFLATLNIAKKLQQPLTTTEPAKLVGV